MTKMVTKKNNTISPKLYFIKALAKFLVEDQAYQSIRLGTGNADAKKWAELRNATPLFGYPTLEEAEEILIKFLGC